LPHGETRFDPRLGAIDQRSDQDAGFLRLECFIVDRISHLLKTVMPWIRLLSPRRSTVPDPTGKSPAQLSTICPTPRRNNILIFRNSKSDYIPRHPVPLGGAFRERHERRDGPRWAVAARETGDVCCGRSSRMVLTSLKLVSSFRSAPRATAAQLSPGRSRSSCIDHCAGMPGVSGVTVAHLGIFFAAGCIGARYPRAL
jgi:hypothetical protein